MRPLSRERESQVGAARLDLEPMPPQLGSLNSEADHLAGRAAALALPANHVVQQALDEGYLKGVWSLSLDDYATCLCSVVHRLKRLV